MAGRAFPIPLFTNSYLNICKHSVRRFQIKKIDIYSAYSVSVDMDWLSRLIRSLVAKDVDLHLTMSRLFLDPSINSGCSSSASPVLRDNYMQRTSVCSSLLSITYSSDLACAGGVIKACGNTNNNAARLDTRPHRGGVSPSEP